MRGTLSLAWPPPETWPWFKGNYAGLSLEHLKRSPRLRALAPTLAQRHSKLPPAWQAARLYEEQRWSDFTDTVQEVLEPLQELGLTPYLLGGTRLGHEYLRHVHDLDIWLPPDDWEAGFQAFQIYGSSPWRHPGGLPLSVHRHPFSMKHYSLDESEWKKEERFGMTCHILSPEAELLRVLTQASCTDKGPIWVFDAQHLICGPLVWESFLSAVKKGGMCLPALAGLHFLGPILGGPVPDQVLTELRDLSLRHDRKDWEAWWQGLRRRRTRVQQFKAGTLREKLGLVRWVLS